MSKPQAAAEPSMEEILASIRKMISDDRPGPSPMPDQMGRTPFGEPARSVSEFSGRTQPEGAARPGGAQPTNFNSLADALKVATALSDQRRSLQQEIATAIERGPRGTVIDPLGYTTAGQPAPASGRHDGVRLPEGSAPAAPASGERQLPSFPAWDSQQPAKQPADERQDSPSFDFGTVVPQRETAKSAAAAAETKAAPERLEAKAEPATSEDSRVVSMPSRNITPAATSSTVAPFPRPAREAGKPETEAATEKKIAEQPAAVAPSPDAVRDAASDKAEALLDAVVDMVQQQPGTLSVFTSGASFIGGIAGKKHSELVAAAAAAKEKAVASAAPGAPPKLDGAAAELLRPMLRQWLADNMPRIVEDALRSEITSDDKGPGKS